MIEIRHATGEDLEVICKITEEAKESLRNMGLSQWQKGYPSGEVWVRDIGRKTAYVAVEEGEVLGVFSYQNTADASYGSIEGKWLQEKPYACMHRVCVSLKARGRGVAGLMFAYGCNLAKKEGFAATRIDTHPGNLPMQSALTKAGFQKCGVIHLATGPEAGDERIGFEKILSCEEGCQSL